MKTDQKAELLIQHLVKQLQEIAEKNDDEFCYKIEIISRHPSIQYRFVCKETTDSHEILTGMGSTIELAILDATKDIKEACEFWGYKFVE